MWANLLQLSLQFAVERSWRIAAEASWYIPCLGMTCGQLKHVICNFACRFSCNVGCRLPITLLPICCCQQSAQLCQLPGDYKKKLLNVLRSRLTIWASRALPTSELTAYCRWADTLQGLETVFYSYHKHVVIVSTFRCRPCSLDLGADPSRRSHHVIFHVKVRTFQRY